MRLFEVPERGGGMGREGGRGDGWGEGGKERKEARGGDEEGEGGEM